MENQLTHHGIKGQKWGVRRFQNKDGSLTAAGKRRIISENSSGNKPWDEKPRERTPWDEKPNLPQYKSPSQIIPRSLKSEAQRQSEKQKRKDSKERGTLSDEELDKKIKRLEKEEKLQKLTNSQVNAGRKYVQNILKSVGEKVIVTAASGALLYTLQATLNGKFDPGKLGDAVLNGGAKKK